MTGDQDTVLLLTDEDASFLVSQGNAVYAPEYDPVEFVGPEKAAERLEQLKATVTEYAATAERQLEALDARYGPSAKPPAELPGEREAEPELKQPWSTASKAEWITWAAHGDHGQTPVTEEEAAAMTKIQLMSRYGSRL